MNDILALIAEREPVIVERWCKMLRTQRQSSYANLNDNDLRMAVGLSAQLMLHVMQTGKTSALAKALHANARRRIAENTSYADAVAAWFMYREVIHCVLSRDLNSPNDWEQFVDRIDTALNWVLEVISDAYAQADETG